MAPRGAIARRYAEAVFDLGRQHNSVDRWRSDLAVIRDVFGDRRLAFVLNEPKIPFSQKEQILRDLLTNKVQPDALGLALLLVERKFVELPPMLVREFETLYDDYTNQARAVVTTAVPLDASSESQIQAYLQRLTGKTVSLTAKVDPTILGGFVARIGDTLIDASVQRKLGVLREQIISGNTATPDRA